MVSVAQFKSVFNGGITKIVSLEHSFCPVCGGKLHVHGTCIRKVRTGEGEARFQLRVLECRTCGKTHRELPVGIVPYKRHGLDSICEIVEAPENLYPCETSTWLRLRAWVKWFLWVAQKVLAGLKAAELVPANYYPGSSLRDQTASFVRMVVNSGNWIRMQSFLRMP